MMMLKIFLFACMCYLHVYSYQNSSECSQPNPGYILAESDGGLSNRLRVLAAYMYVGEYKFHGAHLAFIWDSNRACPGHFLELFEPISTVIFASNMTRYVLDKHAKIVYENSLAVMTWTLTMNDIPKNRFGQLTWHQVEWKMYSRFIPRQSVMDKVVAFVQKYNICNCTAMHLRTTDMAQHLAKKKKYVNIGSYFKYVESRPEGEPVYLLTDNPDTQHLFLEKYGPHKILVYEVMTPSGQQTSFSAHTSPHLIDSTSAGASSSSSSLSAVQKVKQQQFNSSALPSDHRFTSLEHTLIDVLIAAHAKELKPAMYSSLSDLIRTFGAIGKDDWRWCK